MIQLLATRYNKPIAYVFALIFYVSMVMPVYGMRRSDRENYFNHNYVPDFKKAPTRYSPIYGAAGKPGNNNRIEPAIIHSAGSIGKEDDKQQNDFIPGKKFIDGPSQPEMSSFKSAGTNDMVNLFTGDFSYNIPLLDVGGYPVNIFYDGGVGMEEEASWVGLGWNINPGNVNRNMRGVPDDFNGEETLKQELKIKPNINWGVRWGADVEVVGIKDLITVSAGGGMGVSFNNYLGPELEMSAKGTVGITIASKTFGEKSTADSNTLVSLGANLTAAATLSSRYGLTTSVNTSLTARAFHMGKGGSLGVGLATSYNSRTGIKDLQLSSQASFDYMSVRKGLDKKTKSIDNFIAQGATRATLTSSTISFTKPTYLPSMRSVNTNSAWSGHFQLGLGMFGVAGSAEVEVYKQKSRIADGDIIQQKPMVGFLHLENAVKNRDAIMDFSRINDREVTPKTPIVSAPEYAYDVFSIQGEGTGGTIRAYRNDIGYMKDKYTVSRDENMAFGADIDIPGHYGANVNLVYTPSSIGDWNIGNKLRTGTVFSANHNDQENVYFKNPGESCVLNDNQYDAIGGTDLVRYKLGGDGTNPTVEPRLERFSADQRKIGETPLAGQSAPARSKRTQVVSFLTALEASEVGLEKTIRSYNAETPMVADSLSYTSIDRFGGYRKKDHISKINVTESDGKIYEYGLPVYNCEQKDLTFTVAGINPDLDEVPYTLSEKSPSQSPHMSGQGKDGYIEITTTPPYSHSFLLTGLLSPDYVDVTGNGITEDDLGTAVKFNYTEYDNHVWRTPHTATSPNYLANFNGGKRTYDKDDKGIISYGTRESWYLHSIESKTMIAFFILGNRNDGKGITGEDGGISSGDNSVKRLDRIELYNKADVKKNGFKGATPIKTVHFEYDYSLCKGTPDNITSGGGKLTLQKIYFTYNGQNRSNKNQYKFSYANGATETTDDNPNYLFNASDRWGTYKPASENPGSLRNADYPYTIQDKTKADKFSTAWSLKKILLPSGGQLEVEYESDDYAYVQDKRAAAMSTILGFSSTAHNPHPALYAVNGSSIIEYDYVFIKVPEACTDRTDVFEKYIRNIDQLAFKIAVQMPRGYEYLPCYAKIADWGVYSEGSVPAIWIKMEEVGGMSPLSLTAIEFLREELPGQAFPGYDVSESSGLAQVGEVLKGFLTGMASAFKDIPTYLRGLGRAKLVDLDKSFVRINAINGFKLGGGQRVKKVMLTDNWKKMSHPANPSLGYNSTYGQEYDYTTKEVLNGVERTISSGVASYEPSIGGEENPFQTIVRIANELPMGPTSYGAIEMPMLDAFFPAPVVGYSKVTVTSIGKKQNPDPEHKKTRSGVGRQVTEFYTAKDYPVHYTNTFFDNSSDLEAHKKPKLSFFTKHAFDSKALSQGFLVSINDMHGRMKSQTSYADNDPTLRVNRTENFYRNTGSKGLDEKFDFIDNRNGGVVAPGNMGIDIELMTDTREFAVRSISLEIQAQVDWIVPGPIPIWLPFIWPVLGHSENIYRAVTTTKVINYHAVLDSISVIDKGSQVGTKNMVYDAETGQVVISRTNNEFDKPIYSVNYPAYWAYSGMGPAYRNIDAIYSGVNFKDGKITNGVIDANKIKQLFESGDELYIMNSGSPSDCAPIMASSAEHGIIWALNKHKDNTSSNDNSALTDINPDFIFIDKNGKPYSRNGVTFRIIRSGKRNMLTAPTAAVGLMKYPVDPTTHKLVYSSTSRVINSSAIEYREKRPVDNDVIYKYTTVTDPLTCNVSEVEDCNGHLEKTINPYRKGILGNFQGFRSMVYYGERTEADPAVATNLPLNGFLKDFSPYWSFNSDNNLVPDLNNTKWVWNMQTTRTNSKGLELETKDALEIYTSAQYGYHKTLPVAIANNSRYNEMAYDGFEDYDYDDRLNVTNYNGCAKKHVDFPADHIVNAESLNFNAHTGKNVLKLNQSETLTKTVNVGATTPDNFPLSFTPITLQQLNTVGGNVECLSAYPQFLPSNQEAVEQQTLFANGGFSIGMYPMDTFYTNSFVQYRAHGFHILTYYYINVPASGTYNPSVAVGADNSDSHENNSLGVTIEDLNGNVMGTYYTTETGCCSSGGGSVYLCKGIYKITGNINNSFEVAEPGFPNQVTHYCTFTFGIDVVTNCYKDLTTVGGCTYSQPIPATDAMVNPILNLPTGKKMVFSAWVKDNCTTNNGGACANSNQVDIKAGSSTLATIKPSGPVIEGWQRYEGYFTIPAGATSVDILLKNNSSSQAIYFDDIRIHPFNSNMKSYVYDPVNLRLLSELDANNYASFYEYDEEGILIRTKAETKDGIKTITESRSAKQKNITDFQ